MTVCQEREMWRVSEWFSYSHWGLFAVPLFTAPEFFCMGLVDTDDELFEYVGDGEGEKNA
jgi:hypothetical protein